ncbi:MULTISPECIES: heme biosynthesis protein HemY [unclassified Aureimonas]|uniref:heme biosynthesis protein HemY n=1 Tax=unclassified Aureimonas TaxID=2615206 RepID=UPI000700D4E6|nr:MULTISPECIES: heme biosynthesis HemY N-terminal domain-containing protein [unclassified Aureimonas]KQT61854.1 heme biosynthesis protein HemY [Aureimonas sp. Leaf427]KQT74886.1 heme biosynthesis protein HemY [Aureimonas sp. Leaf460]
MLRILAFFLIVLVFALGFSWLADNPGSVQLTFLGSEVGTSFMVFVILQLLLVAAAVLGFWLLRGLFKTPGRIGGFFRTRRRDKGYQALSTGILAAGAGDAVLARRMTRKADKFLGVRREPLVRFLDAQTAMIEGDHGRARSVFESMERDPQTRLLALRGLYLEAERLGDDTAARAYAEQAARIAPHVPWAGGAVLESKAMAGDYRGALDILEAQRSNRLIDAAESKRLRAVLLTAQAIEVSDRDPEAARTAAVEAHKLAPDLTPAAVAASRALFRLGDLKRGSKILEAAWTAEPHPDLAVAYVHARPGDSVADRLRRARRLQELRPSHVESHIAVAHAALDAKNVPLARAEAEAALKLEQREGLYLLMADIEEAEGGTEGRVREWLGRAIRAPRDPAWTADGTVAEVWSPISPVTGRIDAFRWKVPTQRLGAPGAGTAIEAEPAGPVLGSLGVEPSHAAPERPVPGPGFGGGAIPAPASDAAAEDGPHVGVNGASTAKPEGGLRLF